jgi:phage-related minor tail protein
MNENQNISVKLDADTSGFDAAMRAASESTRGFGRAFTSTLKSAVLSGKALEDTMRQLAMRISSMALTRALAPVEGAIGNVLDSILGSLAAPAPMARGGVVGEPGVRPFARGGVVSQPVLFGFAGGTGLMGEAGPEAVMPLKRGADGRLGVAAAGNAQPVQVVFNVTATDAASFKRSEGQLTAMLSRAVQRGNRSI